MYAAEDHLSYLTGGRFELVGGQRSKQRIILVAGSLAPARAGSAVIQQRRQPFF